MSQKQKRKAPKKLSSLTIAQIAKSINDGEIALPDMDLENNADFAAVWALVDSGAGKSCANKSKHFPFFECQNKKSDTRMSMADGTELPSRGNFTLPAISAEGHDLSMTFEDTDVEMPICAVSSLSDCGGTDGSQVIFDYDKGEIVKVSNDATSAFVKRKGVYFIKLFIPRNNKNAEASPSFTRLGAA